MHVGLNNQSLDSATGKYDYSYIFKDAVPYLQAADYATACIETTFDGTGNYTGYPRFVSPDSFATDLASFGIDFLNTASNHSLDSYYNGLVRTLEVLDGAGIAHAGTYSTQEGYDDPVTVADIGGISAAIVAFTYNTNWNRTDEGYAVNYFTKDWNRDGREPDYDRISYCLSKAREKNADLIIAYMHWGDEYDIYGNAMQRQVAEYLFDNGVTIVLGGHVHVPQPMQYHEVKYPDGTTGTGFICYCLGNFVSAMNDEHTNESAILNLQITRASDGSVSVHDANYIPFYMYDAEDDGGSGPRFRLIDIHKAISELEAGDYSNYPFGSSRLVANMKTSLQNIHKIMGAEFDPETR